jgi:hypothetical protein
VAAIGQQVAVLKLISNWSLHPDKWAEPMQAHISYVGSYKLGPHYKFGLGTNDY